MKRLEEQIIAACLHESKYTEVEFLEAKDFTDYPDALCRSAWNVITENKGDDILLMDALNKIPENLRNWMISIEYKIVGMQQHRNHALFLLEMRFKTLLADLLSQLSIKTKNGLESKLLNECILAVPGQDIFKLSDHLLEYLGHHASDYTKGRIQSFLNYRDNRSNNAKQILNEFR